MLAVLAFACGERNGARVSGDVAEAAPSDRSAAISSRSTTGGLTPVTDVSEVCMVNDRFMGRRQIPVLVEGRTYYGCCEMCKGRLERDAATRTATDPFSHRPVDKARALIARNESGEVLYFESGANLASYVERARTN